MAMPSGPQPPSPGDGWGARASQPSQPPRTSRTCLVVALVVGAVALLGVIALIAFLALVAHVDDPHRDGPDGPTGDVKLTGCTVDADTQWPRADLDVTNRSSEPSDYTVAVEFVGPSGERLTEAHTAITHLAPGQVAHDRAQSLAHVDAPVTCRITGVTRFASS
ncbi:hypothetical protein ABZY44_02795 [Streptomyces sp. NPDC006544]|uniref:hypothetical protein n=1 Tax=Streptomyces sp. NPDC006544 TaxID=3154583 RepID=UPI0033B85BBC